MHCIYLGWLWIIFMSFFCVWNRSNSLDRLLCILIFEHTLTMSILHDKRFFSVYIVVFFSVVIKMCTAHVRCCYRLTITTSHHILKIYVWKLNPRDIHSHRLSISVCFCLTLALFAYHLMCFSELLSENPSFHRNEEREKKMESSSVYLSSNYLLVVSSYYLAVVCVRARFCLFSNIIVFKDVCLFWIFGFKLIQLGTVSFVACVCCLHVQTCKEKKTSLLNRDILGKI